MFDTRARLLAGLTAALVLVPYATTGLDLRTGMVVQAILLLALTSGLLLLACRHPSERAGGLLCRWWRRLDPRDASNTAIWWFTAAIVWGAGMALVQGNDSTSAAGQILAMGLLPLGFAAGRLQPTHPGRPVVLGFAVAVAVAIVTHLAAWFIAAATGRPMVRLFLANTIGVVGLLPLLVPLLLAARTALSNARHLRWSCDAALALTFVYLIGSGVRGAWISLGVGVFLWSVLRYQAASPRRRRQLLRTTLLTVVLLALLLGLTLGLPAWWLHQPRQNLLEAGEHPAVYLLASEVGVPATSYQGDRVSDIHFDQTIHDYELPAELRLNPRRTYRLRAWIHGHPSSLAYVAVRWKGRDGKLLHRPLDARALPLAQLQKVSAIRRPPAGSHSASLHFGLPKYGSAPATDPPPGLWILERIELHDLGPAWTAPFWRQIDYTLSRLRSFLPDPLRASGPGNGLSIDYRWLETRSLLHHFAAAPWGQRLAGHGLGATYQLLPADELTGLERLTGRLDAEHLNYIHNFYAFLLYKLGLVGTLLVAIAFALWFRRLARLHRRGLAEHTGSGDAFLDLLPAALLCALAAYLLWGVSSPELINFRLTPVLGLTLATATRLRSH